jgi:hypothetical protein
VADWIDTAAPGRSEFVELLAYHLDAAYHGERDDPRGDPARASALRVRAFEATLVASEDARRRYAIAKALRLAERAKALADSPLERALAYEQTGTTALSDYRGDLVWESFREAVGIRLAHIPQDATAIARACAYAVESPTRWPGSMSSTPPEEEVERYIGIGFDHIGEGDSVERVRLLTARAFAPFAYAPIRGTDQEELTISRRGGVEAATMAERLGRPDLASAALDGATSTGVIVGRYVHDIELMERRIELLRGIDDPWEQGDAYAMIAWSWACIGDLERSLEFSRDGRANAEGAGADGIVIHLSAWMAYASYWLGDFDGVMETLAFAETLLGDRRADPPYFTQNLYGAAALVASIRGADVLRSRIVPIVEAMAAGRAGGSGAVAAGAWRAWIAARDGAQEEAASFLEQAQINTRGHWPVLLPAWAVALAEAHRWDRVPAFLAEYRPWGEEMGLRLLPPAFDRLEGQAALAGDEPAEAAGLLARAAETYGELGARWERACTQLALAEALLAAGRAGDARAQLGDATPVVTELGSLLEMERAAALAARL